jgi:hypothetical protein
MVYSRGGIPVGDYDPDRIVNLGDGHASWDNGFGYTYFNAATGMEFTAVSGLTYNFTKSFGPVAQRGAISSRTAGSSISSLSEPLFMLRRGLNATIAQ